NLGLIPRGSASADLKPSKSSDFEWPRKTSESFSWRLKLPVAKRKFIQSGIVCKTRKIGKSDYFKLNLDNQFVKNLLKLDWSLTKRNVLPEIKEEVSA
ncbi:MAG: hypothetical protein Q8N99_00880, partial [Nanoarchaeota archaeon]|nr:hypothetical protein [Nanoarchaeota archaeon]